MSTSLIFAATTRSNRLTVQFSILHIVFKALTDLPNSNVQVVP